MSYNEVLAKNITVIIRGVGERTEQLCYELVRRQIPAANVHISNISPFTEALRSNYKIGIREKRKWTLIFDADVLVKPNTIEELFIYAEKLNEDVFEIEGLVIDKFLNTLRHAGNHLYRTNHLSEALKLIPHHNDAIRPETYVKNKMRSKGFQYHKIDKVIGCHDFLQSYKDIYRKSYIQAKKHNSRVKRIKTEWEMLSEFDNDYKVALMGFNIGDKVNHNVAIDTKATFMNEFESNLSRLGLEEKTPLSSSSFDFGFEIIQTLAHKLDAKESLTESLKVKFKKAIKKLLIFLRIFRQ